MPMEIHEDKIIMRAGTYVLDKPWVGLTDKEIDQGLCRTNYAMQAAGAWRDGVEWAIKQLQERNS
jgi:hypothetical protein